MSLEETFGGPSRGERLAALRADGRQRVMVVLGGVLLGLGLGSLHWFGLVVGGAVVALPARTFPRGLASGLGLGVLALLVFAAELALQGALGPALTTGLVGGISVAIGLALPLLGSLVRGLD